MLRRLRLLPSDIELFIEHEILQGTVKRYTKNIALTNFIEVNSALFDTHKEQLSEIFEGCYGFIKGHIAQSQFTMPQL